MSAVHIAVLGAIAGLTIFLGLPIARLRSAAPRLRALLNATAVGILLFLLWDVLAHAWEPVDAALAEHHYASGLLDGLVLAVGILLGLLGLVYFDRWVASRRTPTPTPTPTPVASAGRTAARGGTAVIDPVTETTPTGAGWRSAPGQLALLIAVGIGLHNFAEGLAIGSSAAAGEINMAVMLVIGFAAHNATEGFGIVAPLTGTRPSWGRLVLLGLIAGGPTFVGTLIGQAFTGELVSIAFLALAGGSILYVIIELLAVLRRADRKLLTSWGLLLGLVLGFATDALLVAAGA